MRRRTPVLMATLAGLAAASPPSAAAAVGVVRVGTFAQPVLVAAAPGDPSRAYVVERRGRVRLVRRGRVLVRPFLDMRSLVRIGRPRVEEDQGGLLSFAARPRSSRVYVLYTGRDGSIHLDELRRAGLDRADPRTRRRVASFPRPSPVDLGGHLAFGPDGALYIGLGFGDDPANSQDPATPLGKLLRIDPRLPGARPQVWAYGVRAPWRFSFDRLRGDLALGDVGDDHVEEVDFLPRGTRSGVNLGYPFFEGDRRVRQGEPAGLVAPVLTRPHGRGGFCALIGGYVVRDRRLPTLYGRYLYGDLCGGGIRSVRLRRPRATGDRAEPLRLPGLTSFGEDGGGRIYLAGLGGAVYRLAAR